MKKFLLCMLLAGLMMPAVAQEKLPLKQKETRMAPLNQRDAGSSTQMMPTTRETLVNVGLWKSAGISKSYDMQTQGCVYPMAKMHKDKKFIGCVWTNDDNPKFGDNTPYRGVGYSYSKDGGQTWSWNTEETQENRLGGIPVYWPSYAQWGENGEAVMARTYDTYEYEYEYEGEINNVYIKDGLVLFTRKNRGEGAWNITPIPYPEGADPVIDKSQYFMAWGSMTTSGEDNQYIHIITPMSTEDTDNFYKGYYVPMLYYRTQDGKTWDVAGEVVPEMVGQNWGEYSYFSDALSWAVQGNTIACSFTNLLNHAYVIRSYDNGDNWECIKYFDSPIQHDLTPDDFDEDVYIPTQGCLALDSKGKIHIAFAVLLATNAEELHWYGSMAYVGSSFLSYWNEDMPPIDGAADFHDDVIYPIMWNGNCMDEELTDWESQWYVVSTVPEWPIIGYPVPLQDEHYVTIDQSIVYDWATHSYSTAGCFSHPQMIFDANDVLHLVYLGLLDGGAQGSCWKRHPFYTTSPDGGKTWTKTEYLINSVAVVDQEFAYPVLAGISADNKLYMMAQVDPKAGIYTYDGDHDPNANSFYFFTISPVPCPDCDENGIETIDYTPLTMELYPNPAAGKATVEFAGKGDITVYNMLGQAVYHVENVENQKEIPLNMASGVYFVTVRSGNATTTQKLIVK